MLISTDKRFILLSPTKVASSSVGALLSEFCDIRIGSPAFGKHDELTEVVDRYRWLFDIVPIRDFKIFLLFRNPIDRAVSLYASHLKRDFDDTESSTAGMSASEFTTRWMQANTWMSFPQFLHGLLAAEGFCVDYVIRSENLITDINGALDLVGASVDLTSMKFTNQSPQIEAKNAFRKQLQERLASFYAIDQQIHDEFAGRPLCQSDKRAIFSRIQDTYGAHAHRNKISKLVFESLKESA